MKTIKKLRYYIMYICIKLWYHKILLFTMFLNACQTMKKTSLSIISDMISLAMPLLHFQHHNSSLSSFQTQDNILTIIAYVLWCEDYFILIVLYGTLQQECLTFSTIFQIAKWLIAWGNTLSFQFHDLTISATEIERTLSSYLPILLI